MVATRRHWRRSLRGRLALDRQQVCDFRTRRAFYAWQAETDRIVWAVCHETTPAARPPYQADDTGFAPLFGVGLQTVLDGALVRIEYQRTDVGDLSTAVRFNAVRQHHCTR